MKKLISTIMCLALLVGCLAGCGGNTQTGSIDGKGLKILLSLSKADTFRNVLVAQAQQTAEECGAQLDVFDAENSTSTGATPTASLKTICNNSPKNCKICPEMPCAMRVSRAVYCPVKHGNHFSE